MHKCSCGNTYQRIQALRGHQYHSDHQRLDPSAELCAESAQPSAEVSAEPVLNQRSASAEPAQRSAQPSAEVSAELSAAQRSPAQPSAALTSAEGALLNQNIERLASLLEGSAELAQSHHFHDEGGDCPECQTELVAAFQQGVAETQAFYEGIPGVAKLREVTQHTRMMRETKVNIVTPA